MIYLTNVKQPFLQSTLIAICLSELLIGIFMEKHRHPLTQCTTLYLRYQSGTMSQFVEITSISQLQSILKDIGRKSTQNTTETICCRTEIVGTKSFTVFLTP